MAGNVYSTYEKAKYMAYERMKELEQDIFICHSAYKSGEEFVLKTRNEMSCTSYLYMLELPFKHKFKNKKNAEREASTFASKRGKPVYFNKKINLINGYNKISHYYLTHIECLT